MIEVLKLALKALNAGEHAHLIMNTDGIKDKVRRAIAELESQEPYGWVSQHTTKGMYEWQFNKEIAGVYQDTAISILPVYTAPPQRTEQNFCPRCGKRTKDIHTCTPPQRSESSGKPSAWVGLTNDELTDLFYNTNLGQQSAVAQAIALLEEKNT
jgi:hypothetical protein